MAYIRKQNIFTSIWATVKFTLFWLLVFVQLPLIVLMPRGRISVAYMRVFMWFLLKTAGIRVRINGKLVSHRPLLVITNHISIFEIATFPVAFGGSFVAKKEIESWPVVGWVAKKFGVIFVDRRPSHAVEALAAVQRAVQTVSYPMFLFPEGTTTNGAYVKAFKSTLFNFVENSNVVVQPMATVYRHLDGSPISDTDMATHYAYFDNAKQDTGPRAPRERSAFMQLFHIMVIGGFRVDITIMEPADVTGMDRKQIASALQKIVSDEYMKIKDKELKK